MRALHISLFVVLLAACGLDGSSTREGSDAARRAAEEAAQAAGGSSTCNDLEYAEGRSRVEVAPQHGLSAPAGGDIRDGTFDMWWARRDIHDVARARAVQGTLVGTVLRFRGATVDMATLSPTGGAARYSGTYTFEKTTPDAEEATVIVLSFTCAHPAGHQGFTVRANFTATPSSLRLFHDDGASREATYFVRR